MNITYDPHTDTLVIEFNDHPVAESDEEKPGVILDYDQAGNLVGMEILEASQRIRDVNQVHFSIATPSNPSRS